jgi:hypothetical protein
MKRVLLSLLIMSGSLATADIARAEFGGPIPPQQAQPTGPTAGEQERYGLLPAIRQVVFWKAQAPVPPANVPYPHPPYMPPQGMPYPPPGCAPGYMGSLPGTLVFPQHQYIRSPRDFFMYKPAR